MIGGYRVVCSTNCYSKLWFKSSFQYLFGEHKKIILFVNPIPSYSFLQYGNCTIASFLSFICEYQIFYDVLEFIAYKCIRYCLLKQFCPIRVDIFSLFSSLVNSFPSLQPRCFANGVFFILLLIVSRMTRSAVLASTSRPILSCILPIWYFFLLIVLPLLLLVYRYVIEKGSRVYHLFSFHNNSFFLLK